MPTMNISITAEVASFVEAEVASGRYASASELVRESLRLLQREKEVEQEKLIILRRAVQEGLDDLAAGRLSDLTVADIREEVLAEER